MESNGSFDSNTPLSYLLSNSRPRAPSRATSPTGRRKKTRSTPRRKGNPTTLPPELLKHMSSFLHPVNRVALRQTSSAFRGAVNRHPTKRNALRVLAHPYPGSSFHRPEQIYPAAQNRLIMNTSGRRYMKHDQARKYLEKMFTYKGSGNLFGMRPLVFPAMSGATPTDKQRLALAQAITSDTSKEGTEFMYKLIKKIRSPGTSTGDHSIRTLSPRSMAAMYSKKGPGRRKVF
jgi:hypothetical protein